MGSILVWESEKGWWGLPQDAYSEILNDRILPPLPMDYPLVSGLLFHRGRVCTVLEGESLFGHSKGPMTLVRLTSPHEHLLVRLPLSETRMYDRSMMAPAEGSLVAGWLNEEDCPLRVIDTQGILDYVKESHVE